MADIRKNSKKDPSISEMIKEFRGKRKMTLQEIATVLDISLRSVKNYEDGQEPKDRKVNERIRELYETGEISKSGNDIDYKDKVIELYEKLSSPDLELINKYNGEKFTANMDIFSFHSLLSIEAKINILTDLLTAQLAEGDPSKAQSLLKKHEESYQVEKAKLIEKYNGDGINLE